MPAPRGEPLDDGAFEYIGKFRRGRWRRAATGRRCHAGGHGCLRVESLITPGELYYDTRERIGSCPLPWVTVIFCSDCAASARTEARW